MSAWLVSSDHSAAIKVEHSPTMSVVYVDTRNQGNIRVILTPEKTEQLIKDLQERGAQ